MSSLLRCRFMTGEVEVDDGEQSEKAPQDAEEEEEEAEEEVSVYDCGGGGSGGGPSAAGEEEVLGGWRLPLLLFQPPNSFSLRDDTSE